MATRPLRRGLPPALGYVALLVAILAVALAVVVARGLVRPRPRLWEAGAIGLPLALALARVTGGAASPAMVAAALAVLAVAYVRGLRIGAGACALALATLAIAPKAGLGSLFLAAALLVGIGLVPVWLVGRDSAVDAREEPSETGSPAFVALPRGTPVGTMRVAGALRHEAVEAHARDAERRQAESLAAMLADVRDLHGAELAVFWRFTPTRDQLVATGWTGGGAAPTMAAEWAPHVEWAAREGMGALDTTGGAPAVAAVPVMLQDGNIYGALSVHHRRGLRSPAERLRLWLPRHAVQLGRLAALIETTREYARDRERTGAILDAVMRFQAIRVDHELAAAVLEAALEVTGGTRAALVQWMPYERQGRVVLGLGDGMPPKGSLLAPNSVLMEHCLAGMNPVVWEDARHAVAGRLVLTPDELPREIGSLGVYPLESVKQKLHATIVVEGAAPHSVLARDIPNVALLGSYASVALETMWQIADATRDSQTDMLTGLFNRRHFDDQMRQVKMQCERYGQHCALIVADVDHFKKVNDTFGHDGGDAVLKAVAGVFKETVRNVDICARFGGEEIAVLLPSTPLSGAVELAERLRVVLEGRTIRHSAREIRVTASFGVAAYPDTGRVWDGLFAAADRALYEAKREGRNCVRAADTGAAPIRG